MSGGRLEIRSDILEKVTSAEATRVTPYLSMIYLRLVQAPPQFRVQKDVLRFTAAVKDGKTVMTAWAQICALLKVSQGIAKKALEWLHDQKIITYSSSPNGREIIISFEGLIR